MLRPKWKELSVQMTKMLWIYYESDCKHDLFTRSPLIFARLWHYRCMDVPMPLKWSFTRHLHINLQNKIHSAVGPIIFGRLIGFQFRRHFLANSRGLKVYLIKDPRNPFCYWSSSAADSQILHCKAYDCNCSYSLVGWIHLGPQFAKKIHQLNALFHHNNKSNAQNAIKCMNWRGKWMESELR